MIVVTALLVVYNFSFILYEVLGRAIELAHWKYIKSQRMEEAKENEKKRLKAIEMEKIKLEMEKQKAGG